MTGTPSGPHARLLGSVRRSEADLPGPSVTWSVRISRLAGQFLRQRGCDARNIIISKRQEWEEVEAYSSTSNYRIPDDYSGPARKRHHTHAGSQGISRDQQHEKAASVEERFKQVLHDRCKWHPKGRQQLAIVQPIGRRQAMLKAT